MLDLNGCTLSGDLELRAAEGRTLEAIVTNGSFSAIVTGSGDVSLNTDEGEVVATVGQNRYIDLQRALNAANSGDTVRLMSNMTGEGLTIPAGKTVVLDLNGNTYTVAGTSGLARAASHGLVVPKDARLTIRGGTILSANTTSVVYSTGYLLLDGATLSGGTVAALQVQGGEAHLVGNAGLDAPTGVLSLELYGTAAIANVKFEESFTGLVTGNIRVARETGTYGAMSLTILGKGRFHDRVSYEIPSGQMHCNLELTGWGSDLSFDVLKGKANKVIFFIGDGMGPNQIANTKLKYGRSFFIDQIQYTGRITTFSNSRDYTDSAAGGSALATGRKYNNNEVARHNGEDIATICEQAKAAGYGVAIITSDYLHGATPASFTAHANARTDTADIVASQLVVDCADLMMGWTNASYTGETGAAQFAAAGFTLATSMSELESNFNKPKLMGQFISVVPGTGSDKHPNLKTMVDFAVRYMEAHFPNGYIIMAEEARIDKNSHTNRLEDTMACMNGLDLAIESVCNTLAGQTGVAVLLTADHETGGLQLAETTDQLTNSLYTTGNHTAADVPYYIHLQLEEELTESCFTDRMDNTDIYKIMYSLLGLGD